MKRYIIIAFVLIVVLGLGAVWFFMLRTPATSNVNEPVSGSLPQTGTQGGTGTGANGTNSGAGGTLPSGAEVPVGVPTASTKFGVVSNEPVLAYFVDAQNNVAAVEPDGKIVRIANGQATILSSSQIENLITAAFSYDGTKILVNFGDVAKPQTSIFDLATKAWSPLAPGIVSPVWSPNDLRIAYFAVNANGTETLTTFNAAKMTTKPVALISLSAQDLSLAWPSRNTLVLAGRPSALSGGAALLFNLQTQTLVPFTLETPGFSALWNANATNASSSPFGLVFSANTPRTGGRLRLVDAAGNALQSMSFVTLPSKCSFRMESSTLALYCGVPRDQESLSFSSLPDDYEQMALFTTDNIYRIDAASGAFTPFFIDADPLHFDVTNMKFFNNTLFFVNRYDQKLYAISAG